MSKEIKTPKIDLNDVKLSNLQDFLCGGDERPDHEISPSCGDLDCKKCIYDSSNFNHFKSFIKSKFEGDFE